MATPGVLCCSLELLPRSLSDRESLARGTVGPELLSGLRDRHSWPFFSPCLWLVCCALMHAPETADLVLAAFAASDAV